MSDVKIIIGKTSLTLSLEAWKAFLDAAAETIDSGDHYLLLADNYPRSVLREVSFSKSAMRNQWRYSSGLDSELLPEYGVATE